MSSQFHYSPLARACSHFPIPMALRYRPDRVSWDGEKVKRLNCSNVIMVCVGKFYLEGYNSLKYYDNSRVIFCLIAQGKGLVKAVPSSNSPCYSISYMHILIERCHLLQSPLPLRNGFDICFFGAGKAARAGRNKWLPEVFLYLSAQFFGCCFRINVNHI